jgi:hypothetical protein
MHITQWHVPIDDVTCYWYSIFTSFGVPVDRDTMRAQRLESLTLPLYEPRLGQRDNWGFDSGDQARNTYVGVGMDVNAQDQWAVESPGPIRDRTKEHLGKSDVAIVKYRKLLLSAIDALAKGSGAPFRLEADEAADVRGPIALDAIGSPAEQAECWQRRDRERRAASSWARDERAI